MQFNMSKIATIEKSGTRNARGWRTDAVPAEYLTQIDTRAR